MRLVSFATEADRGWQGGVQFADGIAELAAVLEVCDFQTDGLPPRTVRQLLELAGPDGLAALSEQTVDKADALSADGRLHAFETLRLGPPIPDPEKIICLGLNYSDHAREAGLSAPAAPMFFAKYPNSLVGPTDSIVVPPAAAEQVDYEAELAIVIGRDAARVSAEEALSYVAGVTVFNDVSARDLQLANTLWTGGKAVDTFGPCGPALVTLDEIDNIMSLPLRTRVNGELVQDGTTADMIFGVAETIAFLTRIMTLRPGDIIATGTPAGVGNSRTPKLFLTHGDIVEVEIDGIGSLRNPVTIGV